MGTIPKGLVRLCLGCRHSSRWAGTVRTVGNILDLVLADRNSIHCHCMVRRWSPPCNAEQPSYDMFGSRLLERRTGDHRFRADADRRTRQSAQMRARISELALSSPTPFPPSIPHSWPVGADEGLVLIPRVYNNAACLQRTGAL